LSALNAKAATWTPGNNAGDGVTWNTTSVNWSGAPAWTAGTDNATFSTDGDTATIAAGTFVVPTNTGTGITFSGTATVNGGGVGSGIGFVNTNSTLTIDVASGEIGTINADILATASEGNVGNKLFKTGLGKLVLGGTTRLTIDLTTTHENKNSFFSVNGGGELEVTGTFFSDQDIAAATNRQYPTSFIGDTSGGNTLRVSGTGRFSTNDITMGSFGNDNNSIIVSSPGNSGSRSFTMIGDSTQLNMNSSGNSLQVLNGAYFHGALSGAGIGTWTIGTSAGNNNNSILVDGAGSTLVRSNSNFTNVGIGGDGNSLTVQNGGLLTNGRVGIGMGGGDNNYQLITGAGSVYTANAAGNHFFEIGKTAGSNGNSFRVEAGGLVNQSGSGANRIIGVGEVATADNNYMSVTGAGSTLNFINTALALTIGGNVNNSVFASGGDGNHLDVYSGGTLNLDNSAGTITTVPAGSTPVVLMGTNTAFNLGNGTGISTASVGGAKTYASGGPITGLVTGVLLHSADSRLNFNSGRLTTTIAGNLVSGAGEVVLNGPAYISSNVNNVISTAISGAGDLNKEGSGTLQLSNALNSYSGTTHVFGGVLQLDNPFLNDLSTVMIDVGAKMNLNFAGSDTIAALYLGGVLQPSGTYGKVGSGATFQNDVFFNDFPLNTFGSGILNVVGGGGGPVGATPEPSSLILVICSLSGLLASRRQGTHRRT
jgi:autotransporter-associated beta strand protein